MSAENESTAPLESPNGGLIDVWGYVLRLWHHKWVWLGVFAVVFGCSAGVIASMPTSNVAAQRVQLLPSDGASEAEATQQATAMLSIARAYAVLATSPPFTDEFVAKHPEFRDPAVFESAFTVTLVTPLMLEFSSPGRDGEYHAQLVKDWVTSFISSVDKGDAGASAVLLKPQPVGEPFVRSVTHRSTLLLVAPWLLACAGATVVTFAFGYLRSRRTHIKRGTGGAEGVESCS